MALPAHLAATQWRVDCLALRPKHALAIREQEPRPYWSYDRLLQCRVTLERGIFAR